MIHLLKGKSGVLKRTYSELKLNKRIILQIFNVAFTFLVLNGATALQKNTLLDNLFKALRTSSFFVNTSPGAYSAFA